MTNVESVASILMAARAQFQAGIQLCNAGMALCAEQLAAEGSPMAAQMGLLATQQPDRTQNGASGASSASGAMQPPPAPLSRAEIPTGAARAPVSRERPQIATFDKDDAAPAAAAPSSPEGQSNG